MRDVTFDEGCHQLRSGSGPQVMSMSTLRNLAISLICALYDGTKT
ncbi:transposase IS4 family protein [Actinomyces sp. Chiba101]|uniref:Uncharacterized protein n=1 Tax=Actinomyces denticolens TaxID=52767 RepID=A0ABY1IL12_9ACTO|nr:transposase IS4 family protein [Actinomyces sp. Chiba101]GAV94353.1 transposase, IS4 [Actinomyces denticolens]SHJ33045.1 hypothetical protein SAMN05216246_1332 [Actinomyces denticolens]SUU07635.1 Uncharacterised protein [Actinomyces denticolens]